MSKFDTHGGYFAPKDYLRVNEGGSHEENPNGGVQIGVDPEGNPNLLEEGEPVYKDYVYSDNIEAEEQFLVDNNLPKKYAGKLYSKIADDLFSEAEERPLDPISQNGLEVLLGRLADAQEQQKQAKEQRDLENELANLSPEELDQLEAMLAQGEQEQMASEQMPMEAAPEQMMGPAEPIPTEGMPMMANGGPLGKLDPFLKKRFPDEPSMQQQIEYTMLKDMVPEMPDFYPYDFKTRVKAQRAINDEISRQKFVERMRKREDVKKKIIDKLDEFDNKYFGNSFIREYESGPRIGEKRFDIFDDEEPEYKALGGKINRFDDGGWGAFLDRLLGYKESLKPSAMSGKYAIDRRGDFWGGRTGEQVESDPNYDVFTQYVLSHGDDPQVQRYLRALDSGVNTDKGVPLLWDKENNKLFDNWATLYGDRRRDKKLGIYHITPEDIGFLTAPADPATTAQSPQGPDFQYELFPGQFAAMQYGVQMDNLSPRMRYAMSYNGSDSPTTNETNGEKRVADDTIYGGSIDPSIVKAKPESNTNILPTWLRYAGAIGSGLLGLYNAFQSPDRYTAPHINPVLPEGRINLQNQVYNPIDQNMIANAQIAQGNATNRALRNSGLGPSSAAAILAADNNLTGNLGTGFIQAWDANNQRRNAVIAANNQAEAQRAQFDYTVDAARKDAINRFAPYNAQNDLMVQRLNNQAEAEKYQAISNQISNGLQALSGIGQENFAMNQVNTNPSFLGYRVAPNGTMRYMPWYSCNGGFLKKFKK